MNRRPRKSTLFPSEGLFRSEKKKGKRVGGLSAAYARACAYRMPWESAICTPYPLGYVVVLIKTRSPTTMVVPPVPTNWALFEFQIPDVWTPVTVKLRVVKPPYVVIVSLTADVVSPVG